MLEPEIPQHRPNVARLCAATKSTLHLIEPFGFELGDKPIEAGGDGYWARLGGIAWTKVDRIWAKLRLARLWLWRAMVHGVVRRGKLAARRLLVFGREGDGWPSRR